jgi:hypothetical protein
MNLHGEEMSLEWFLLVFTTYCCRWTPNIVVVQYKGTPTQRKEIHRTQV